MILYRILIKDCNYVNKTKDMVISMHICNAFYCSVLFSTNLGILKDKTLSLEIFMSGKSISHDNHRCTSFSKQTNQTHGIS